MVISKEERLLDLFCFLLSTPRPVSFREIKEKVPGYLDSEEEGVRRKFERDKKDLKNLGIELVQKDVPGTYPIASGYFIDANDYYLKDIQLERAEQIALNLFLGLFKIGNESFDGTLMKLGGIEGSEWTSGLDFNPFGMIWLEFQDIIPRIQKAIQQEEMMIFDYINEAGERKERKLEPARLYLFDSRWHVKGYDVEKEAVRSFRLDRIQGELNDSNFQTATFHQLKNSELQTPILPWEYGKQDVEPNKAEILINAENANWAEQQIALPGTTIQITDKTDGSKIFKFNVFNSLQFYRFVASFGEAAEVVGDKKLREGFISYLEELL